MPRLALTLGSVVALCAVPALADSTLTILHTNDFHSRIEPINKYDSTCSAEDAAEAKCFGGSARLKSAIEQARSGNENTLLVDGGDQFQGSLFYTTYKGKAAAELMNRLGYQAMTVGNHEFDDGPKTLRAFMDAIDFPILLANADISGEPALADVLEPSATVDVGGETYGLIGIAPADTGELTSAGDSVTFSDPVAAVKREVEALEGQGIDKIILLSHSGYNQDQRLAREVDGIDVIVGGHDNTLLSNTDEKARGPYPTLVKGPSGNDVAIVQAYAYGKYLGELTVTFNEEGHIESAEGEPLIMDAAVPEDEETLARVAELAKGFEEVKNREVGETTAPIEGDRAVCRVQECEMGDLVADAMLERVRGQGIQIAITNAGGLRASIDEGPITMGEVLTVLPFQNTLSTFQMTGADIKEALENGVSQIEDVAGRFPQVAGLRYVFDAAAEPGQRVSHVEVRKDDGTEWTALDPEKVYGVVSNNFLRGGGDGYQVFADKAQKAYDFGPPLEEVLAEYLAENRPYEPYTDQRIRAAE